VLVLQVSRSKHYGSYLVTSYTTFVQLAMKYWGTALHHDKSKLEELIRLMDKTRDSNTT